jgi:CheY-like chemotaxis protein
MAQYNENGLVLLLIDDLIFVSKVSMAAREAGISTRLVTRTDLQDIDNLVAIADIILVDLHAESINPIEFLREINRVPTKRDTEIICFVSHVRKDLIREAEEFDQVTVMPRSRFIENLAGILQGAKKL